MCSEQSSAKGTKCPLQFSGRPCPSSFLALTLLPWLARALEKRQRFLSPCFTASTSISLSLVSEPAFYLLLGTWSFRLSSSQRAWPLHNLLVGGDSMQIQFEELAQSPDIIIATPGRLMHHLSEVDDMSLRSIEYVVFDEADCLFGMAFTEQLHQILAQLEENCQTLLFSATLPSALAEFVRLDLETKISPDLKLAFFTLRQEEKYAALLDLIREHIGSDQ